MPAPSSQAFQPPAGRWRRAVDVLQRLASIPLLQSLAAVAAYLGFAIYLTWPLASDLDSTIYGAVGDLTGTISMYRELVEEGQFPFAPGTISDFNAPDGLDVRWTLNIVTLFSSGTLYSLSALFGPIAAVGIHTLLGFTLSGLAMFLLVRRLVGHPGVGFIAGFAYAFFPFVVVKAQGHIDYVHGWVLVVPVWRLIELMARPTIRNGVWAGVSLVLAFMWTPYHILFAGVIALALSPVALVPAWKRGLLRPMLSALATAGAIAIVWLAGMVLLDRAGSRSEVRVHTIEEATAFSARAAEYVVPTSEHPLFGKEAGEYRAAHLHGSNASENTLYVGFSVLALALIGFVLAVRQAGPMRQVAVAAAALVVAGFVCSAPPRVDLLGMNLPTITEVLFNITTTWRVFSRMVVVVMLGLVLLAAIGVASIVQGRRFALQGTLLAIVLVVVAADLWTAQPASGTNKIGAPATYLKLANMPDGIAVEYPLLPAEQSRYADIFYQAWHDKPIVNGYFAGSPDENRALRLSDLSDPAVARDLKALGVRYVLVRQDLEAAGLPDPGQPEEGFRLITRDPFIALYELVLPGPAVLVTPMEGFAPAEGTRGRRFQWLLENEGTIELRGACSPCAGVASVTVGSFARPREVSVSTSSGKVVARARVRRTKVFRFPVRFQRRLEVRIRTNPGPQSISDTIGSPDPRSVSVAVTRESFRFQPSTGG